MGSPRHFQSAAAIVDSDAAAPVYRSQRGFASTAITRNGAGDYTLTLGQAYDSTLTKVLATVIGPALHTISVEWASSTTLRVRTTTITAVPAIAAADLDFNVEVQEMGPA